MKNELKKELQNAQNNRSNSGFGFGKLSELDEKLKAVKREIYRHHDFTQTPELTAMVNEVLELAEEIDPDYHGSRRQREKYGLLKEYRHCWKRHKEELKECPISDDSKALIEFVPSLGKLISRGIPVKKIIGENGKEKRVSLKEEEMTEEMREMQRENLGLRIEEYVGDIELKCQLFLYNNALTLIKKAKKLGLSIIHSFESEIKRLFQDERKASLPNRYVSDYKSHEERLQALFNILLSYLGHCQVANYLMNKLTEDLEFTRELLNKAVAIFKKGLKEFCEFLEDFSIKITEKAQSFIMQLFGYCGDPSSNISFNGLFIEGTKIHKKVKFMKLPITANRFIAI